MPYMEKIFRPLQVIADRDVGYNYIVHRTYNSMKSASVLH